MLYLFRSEVSLVRFWEFLVVNLLTVRAVRQILCTLYHELNQPIFFLFSNRLDMSPGRASPLAFGFSLVHLPPSPCPALRGGLPCTLEFQLFVKASAMKLASSPA
jgi:hypothetical protein